MSESGADCIKRSVRRPTATNTTLNPIGRRDEKYSPYAVDWRFLPEPLLTVKDYARFFLTYMTNRVALVAPVSRLWSATIGARTERAVRRAGILFIHIPKSGGTSIAQCLYGRNLPHYTMKFYESVFPGLPHSVPSFAVFRHPEDRLRSVYGMAVQGGTDIVAYSRYWKSKLSGLDSFDSFVEFMFRNRHSLERFPPDLQRQVDFVVGRSGAIEVDRLFAMDRSAGFPLELQRWLAIEKLPHLNASGSRGLVISAESRQRIAEIYDRDLRIFDFLTARGGFADVEALPAATL